MSKKTMSTIQSLLETRKRLKQRKPFFLRQGRKIKKRMKGKWRRPHGLQSKLREKRKGHLNPPSTGYGSPAPVRGLDATGRKPLVVSNLKDLTNATKENRIIIHHTVGQKKKISLVQEAITKGLTLSLKDPSAYLASVAASMKKRAEDRVARRQRKDVKQKEAEQKAREKAAEKPATVDAEEQKEQEKKEIDKILTQQS